MDRQLAQLSALAATHGRLREDNANQRRVVAEYEHYCVLLENTLSSLTNVPVTVMRSNYKNGRPLLHFNAPRSTDSTPPTTSESLSPRFA